MTGRSRISRVHPLGGFLAGLISPLLVFSQATAHPLDQVKAEFQAADGTWNSSLWIEAWATYPEDGPRVPPGSPGDPDRAGQAWLDSLSQEDFETMQNHLEVFIHDAFVLTLDGKPLEFELSLPEFGKGRPQLGPNSLNNAVIRADLSGDFPAGTSGSIALVWNDDGEEPLTVDVIIPREGKKPFRRVMILAPRDEPVELLTVQTDARIEQSREVSLYAWIVAGFEHILPKGVDHILFILGLFFLVPKFRPLLSQSLAFTLAHSITLAMVVLGVFSINPRFVESMIAFSIAYVGIENLWVKELKPWRVAFVFALGLLHGMGFASVMQELEIPKGAIIEPLVGFNLGVEAGQVTVLLAAFAVWFVMVAILRAVLPAKDGREPDERAARGMKIFSKTASATIALIGLYWTFERALG
ncbi:HupE/UreJ family protein [Haloferula sp. A504]|uniref:HupE/UreJ family protein n=1 Tax=Haloferula sp. A504 TaxID=3373601 RepID=UPI0031CB04F5|nr:HupE/UreJ family protein [Verrucomicrobiaceae bacterium E54]